MTTLINRFRAERIMQMLKSALYVLLYALPVLSQSDTGKYLCSSDVQDTCFKKISTQVNKKYVVVEVLSQNAQIGNNIRNILVERIMELSKFEKVFLAVPESERNECLILKTTVADITSNNSGNSFAVGMMFGLAGSFAMMAGTQGSLSVKTDIYDGRTDSLMCSSGFCSSTSRGTSSGTVPYRSIVCIAEAITKYAISTKSELGDHK